MDKEQNDNEIDNSEEQKPEKKGIQFKSDNKPMNFTLMAIALLLIFGAVLYVQLNPPKETITQECCDSFCGQVLAGQGQCNHFTQFAYFCRYNESFINQVNQSKGTTPIFEFLIYNKTKACGE